MLNKLLKNKLSRLLPVLCFIMFAAFTARQDHITIYMIGDSTMSIKEKKAYPETGWGMPFAVFFDEGVTIDNTAKNGRSTKSFISEGLWQPVTDNMKAGDYLLIQFGHNDEVSTKKTYATPDEFKANLTRFITEAKSKGVKPVLITPVARRKFDAAGNIEDTHAVYAQFVRDIAVKENVPLIDLDKKSMEMLQKLGPEQSKLLFNYLQPGENPNYPEGKADDTHFSELGARKVAEMVLAELKMVQPDIVNRIVKVKTAVEK
jgi:lysophospholipase L1-like esterase